MAGSAAQCLAAGCEPQWMPGSERDKRRAADAETTGLSADDFSMVLAILSRPDVWEKVARLAGLARSDLSRECVTAARGTSSRSTRSIRRRASRDRWSISTLGMLLLDRLVVILGPSTARAPPAKARATPPYGSPIPGRRVSRFTSPALYFTGSAAQLGRRCSGALLCYRTHRMVTAWRIKTTQEHRHDNPNRFLILLRQ
jgi:hypothetical protein